jgi:chromosome segregation ATPase
MAEEVGFFEALWRLITFYKARKALGLVRAADAQFTGSAAGISDAYDIHHDQLVKEYKEFFNALSEVESAVESKRGRLKDLQGKHREAQKALDGAIAVYTKAQTAGDQKTMTDAERDGEAFRQEVARMEQQEKDLTEDIQSQEQKITDLEGRLTGMQREIQNLSVEKADAIADFVSNKKLIEAQERLMGLKARIDMGPIDAVRKANQDLAAKARVSGRLAGADADHLRDKYINAGETASASSDFKKLVEARKAEKEQATGSAPANTEDRPKI